MHVRREFRSVSAGPAAIPAVGVLIVAAVVALIVAAPPAMGGQEDSLRIVVIEGEDSVNIIGQGTAVPTVVEVRDRNDLPVAGALVVFLLGGGGTATLNSGLSNVVAMTNALGQAAVTVNPVATGAVQLSVSAAFQGQTAAAAITQTNFATAAAAAAAGAEGPGGQGGGGGETATAGGGGGFGTGALLGIVGAGVGAAVAVAAARPEPCTFRVSPTSFDGVDGDGGRLRVEVDVSPSDCSPQEWTVESNASFISASPLSGSGPADVFLTVGRNGPDERSGTVTIAGQTVRVQQDPRVEPCDTTTYPGGNSAETRVVGLGRSSGEFDFHFQTYTEPDRMIVRHDGRTLLDTDCVGTRGWVTRRLRFSGRSSVVEVEVRPACGPNPGRTGWEFRVSCATP